jgi:hypothetical protein
VAPSITRKSRSAGVQPSGGVLTSAASTSTVGIRGKDVCGYVAGYVLADARPTGLNDLQPPELATSSSDW